MPVLSDKFILRLQHTLDAKLARMGMLPRPQSFPDGSKIAATLKRSGRGLQTPSRAEALPDCVPAELGVGINIIS